MKIWHQSATELRHIGDYKTAIEHHAHTILGDRAQLDVKGMPDGSYDGTTPSDALGNAYIYHNILGGLVEQAVAAEREGYDVFVMGSYSEPYLREMRTAVDIPVVSILESTLLLACSLGLYTGMITNAPNITWLVKMAVDKHKLGSRVLDVVSIDPPLDEYTLEAARENPSALARSFENTALQLIARGADVIIPAEAVLATLIMKADVKFVKTAPVLDIFAATWTHAMGLAELWQTTGLRVGREWHYRRG